MNLLGDVAVVDRLGGIAKIAVKEDRCVDFNGTPGIQTSTGANNILPWGEDECVLWHTQVANLTYELGARPVAWEGIEQDTQCPKENPRVWVGFYDGSTGHFRRLNGNTGEIQDMTSAPWSGNTFGPYGGATNKAGDFWVAGWQTGPLVRIDAVTVQADVYQIPPAPGELQQWNYGMALDKNGDPWVVSTTHMYHFHPDTETWSYVNVKPGGASMRGVMVDKEGIAWAATNDFPPGVAAVDTATETVMAPNIQIPGAVTPVGISIDIEGYVWVVDQGANAAFKIDPDTYELVLTVNGLVSPYTYSDMTGAGLDLVTNPPQG